MSDLPPFLTDDEIAAATAPLTQGAARVKYFERLGVKVKPKPNGQPLVGRAEFEAAMLSRSRQAAPSRSTGNVVRPEWGTMKGFRNVS